MVKSRYKNRPCIAIGAKGTYTELHSTHPDIAENRLCLRCGRWMRTRPHSHKIKIILFLAARPCYHWTWLSLFLSVCALLATQQRHTTLGRRRQPGMAHKASRTFNKSFSFAFRSKKYRKTAGVSNKTNEKINNKNSRGPVGRAVGQWREYAKWDEEVRARKS